MIPILLSDFADEAAQRYDQFAQTLQVIYSSALMSRDFGTPLLADRIKRNAQETVDLYGDDEWHRIHGAIQAVASNAHTSASANFSDAESFEMTDAAQQHLHETQAYVESEISAQMMRDVAQLRQGVQRSVLKARMDARLKGISLRSAQVGQNFLAGQSLPLMFTDRAGRATPSRTFIRNLVRQALLSVYNETTLHAITEQGQDIAAIMQMVDGVAYQTGTLGIEEYAEVRAKWFHPNSNTWLAVETNNVSA